MNLTAQKWKSSGFFPGKTWWKLSAAPQVSYYERVWSKH